jgi:hypothetical protein
MNWVEDWLLLQIIGYVEDHIQSTPTMSLFKVSPDDTLISEIVYLFPSLLPQVPISANNKGQANTLFKSGSLIEWVETKVSGLFVDVRADGRHYCSRGV